MRPMTSERKAEIARVNGAKSRGPKTPRRQGRLVHERPPARPHRLAAPAPRRVPGILRRAPQRIHGRVRARRSSRARPRPSHGRLKMARAARLDRRNRRPQQPYACTPREEFTTGPAAHLTAAFTSYTGNSRFLDCFYRQENAVTRRFDRALDRLLDLQERRHAIHPREIRVTWVDPPTKSPPDIKTVS